MFKRPLLIIAMIALVILLSYLDILAFRYFWYWRLWWFDIVMHVLGGVFLGFAGLWFYALSKKVELKSISTRRALFISLFIAIVFGIVWEFIEFGVDHIYLNKVGFKSIKLLQLGWGDSLGDILSDIVGSVSAALLVIEISRWHRKTLE